MDNSTKKSYKKVLIMLHHKYVTILWHCYPKKLAVWWVEKYMRLSRDLKITWFSLLIYIYKKQQLEHQPAVKLIRHNYAIHTTTGTYITK